MLPLVHQRAECQQRRVARVDGNGIMGLEKAVETFASLTRHRREAHGFGAGLQKSQAGITDRQPPEYVEQSGRPLLSQPLPGCLIMRLHQFAKESWWYSVIGNGLGVTEEARADLGR